LIPSAAALLLFAFVFVFTEILYKVPDADTDGIAYG
jgi:hypothetical protein